MPIYEYECRKCGAHVEALQKISDKPLTKCQKCGGRLEKKWSQAGFQFKGSGWYVTDYARKGGEKKADGDSGSETKAETKSESKSDSKPEAKADAKGDEKKTPKAKSSSKGASAD